MKKKPMFPSHWNRELNVPNEWLNMKITPKEKVR